MKYFCKFIVIDKEEEKSKQPIEEFMYDDYRYWGLFSFDNDELLFLEDNVHRSGIEEEIDSFLSGIRYAGEETIVTSGAVVLDDISCGVKMKDVIPKLLERDFI